MIELTSIIVATILLTSVILIMQDRITKMINILVTQSLLLAFATLVQAVELQKIELYISAGLIIITKALVIPYLLRRLVNKLHIRQKVAEIKYPFLLLAGASALVLFCYQLIMPLNSLAWNQNNNIIAVAMAIMLLGILILIVHRKAISHAIGFISMENGIFLAALLASHGVPMVIEIGIAFDLLIATILFGIFFLQLRRKIDSLDVDRLNLLREDLE